MDEQQRRILQQHVETDRLLGVEAVPVGDGANLPKLSPDSESETASTPAPIGSPPARPSTSGQDRAAPRPAADPADRKVAPIASSPAPNAPEPNPDPNYMPAPPAYHPIDVSEKPALLEALNRDEVVSCRKCVLCEGRTQTVFGEGSPNANLMFVGEGPGQNEDEQGRPFIGRAGKKLDEMIQAMGFSRDDVFIANVVKCRPPNNRAPTPAEADACWPHLLRQIMTIQPMVIVTLGGPATKRLVNPKLGITRVRGMWHHFTGLQPDGPSVPVMPTFHPAYLLRAYTKENREKVWSDLQKAIKLLKDNGGMP